MTMAIVSVQGDLLEQDNVEAIVNTVNCVGVMGKGIALQFKKKWPANFKAYATACKAGEVQVGRLFIYNTGLLATPQYIINFPTKDHWRQPSRIEFIEAGLADLLAQIKNLSISSIAIPPLGCGNGGLDWQQVKPLILNAFSAMPELEVRLFEPPEPSPDMNTRPKKPRPKMTSGRAAILKVLDAYRTLNDGVSKIEIQKLAYFLQETGENLQLDFVKHQYGPYAETLRHALDNMEGHYIRSLPVDIDGQGIFPVEEALLAAETFIQAQTPQLAARIARVAELIDGFQSPYGMELLATVHWVARHELADSPNKAIVAVQAWNTRKRNIMPPEHIEIAWQHLRTLGWI